MKISVYKFFGLALLVGISAISFGDKAFFWSADTLGTSDIAQKVSWYAESYQGEEYEVSIKSPHYDGIFVNINSFLLDAVVDEEVTEKYIKDFLTLRRGPDARTYLKRICRTLAKEEHKAADAATIAQAITKMAAEEPNINSTKIRDYVNEMLFPDSRYKRKLERARAICGFIEEAHEYEANRKKTETMEISVGFVRYLLQNNITYPIPGLLMNVELTDEMKALLLEYKHVKDLKPLINLIENENVSLASFKSQEVKVDVPLQSQKITSVKKRRNTFSDKNFPQVPDFSTPVRR